MISSQTLNIALSDCLAYPRLSVPLAVHRRQHPDVGIRLREQSLVEQHQGLIGGELDAGLCQSSFAPEGIDAQPLWQDTLVLADSIRRPWLARNSSELARTVGCSWITLDGDVYAGYREQISCLQDALGIAPPRVITAHSFELMMTLVAAGYGICLAPASRVERYRSFGVAWHSLEDRPLALTTYLLRPSDRGSSTLERFTESLQAQS